MKPSSSVEKDSLKIKKGQDLSLAGENTEQLAVAQGVSWKEAFLFQVGRVLLTAGPRRVVDAQDPQTLGHLPSPKTTEVRAKEEYQKARKEEEIMNKEKEEEEKEERKATMLDLLLPSSGPLPLPALLQLPWDRGDLPPPPKMPRIDTEKESDSMKSVKGQATQISDGKADALQPENQMVSVHTAPLPVLPSPPPPSGPAGFLSLPTDGISSPGPPAPTLFLCQAAGPPIPSVPSPPLTANIPTIPISPSALPSEPLPPCRARPSVETPPDAKKGPADLTTALASAISHLPRPGPEPLSFNLPSCRRVSPAPMSIAGHPPLPFPDTSLAPSLRNPPTVSTMASHACEDMSWEPSSGPAVMDMDTTPPSEAAILSSPTVSSGSCLPFAPSHGCMHQRLAANAAVSTGPLTLRVPCHTPIGNNLYTPRPSNG
ncbi:nuclear pore-associated protein 1-like [Peromyscus eremicus]|uniref:nuclear pore-associated protein 1-like n=1 Tax=Peromyscus eremicus TaxID=42410 RepID=UPI0027DCE891|nr:nuclear pore-associated protein 1-like [Peromyscus eremicus]